MKIVKTFAIYIYIHFLSIKSTGIILITQLIYGEDITCLLFLLFNIKESGKDIFVVARLLKYNFHHDRMCINLHLIQIEDQIMSLIKSTILYIQDITALQVNVKINNKGFKY